nr:DELLA protein RGL1-like [Ipomoea batatas]
MIINKQLATGFQGYGDDVDLFCAMYGFYQENNQSLGVERILGNHLNPFAANTSSSGGGRDHHQKLPAMQIMRLAGERFVQFSNHRFININIFKHPHSSTLSELCSQDKQDVELVQLILAAIEKVSDKQFDRPIRLVSQCQNSASCTGSPVQRAALYFADALQARIERQTGSFGHEDDGNGVKDDECLASRFNMAYVILRQMLPFPQVVQLSATQTILDHVVTKPKVHLVDFCLRTGVQWSTLMQALSKWTAVEDCGQHYFRFTAIETTEKEMVEETGKRLQSFAAQFNLPFSFNVLYIPDLKHLKAEQVEINADEVETNLTSPSFVHRFIDAMFYYSTYFDTLEDTVQRDDQYRVSIEAGSILDGIRNIVAAEGRERVTRSVSLQVWRDFFGRFGLEGVDLRAREKGGGVLAIQHFSAELIGLGVDEGQLVGEILRENRLRYSHADVSNADDGDFGVTLGRRQQRRVMYRLEEGLA